jgi:phosphoglycolate phosphatase
MELIQMKKLCIFDFDGTMFDSLTDVVKCFNQTFTILGYEPLETDYYKRSLGGNVDEIISLILKDDNSEENVQKVKKTYEKLYFNDPKENTHLFDGVLKLLERLQEEGVLLAINSNRTSKSIEMFITRYAKHINFIDIRGHEYDYPSKPNPYGVNSILEKSGVSRDDCIYIGDSITDVETALNAGVDCILVRWGYGVDNVFEHEYPVAVVDNPEEIYYIIKEKN